MLAFVGGVEYLDLVEREKRLDPGAIHRYRAERRQERLGARTIDLRNSGDTAGPRDRVVGYGAYAFQ